MLFYCFCNLLHRKHFVLVAPVCQGGKAPTFNIGTHPRKPNQLGLPLKGVKFFDLQRGRGNGERGSGSDTFSALLSTVLTISKKISSLKTLKTSENLWRSLSTFRAVAPLSVTLLPPYDSTENVLRAPHEKTAGNDWRPAATCLLHKHKESIALVHHRSRLQIAAISVRNQPHTYTLRLQEILQKELFLDVRSPFDRDHRFRAVPSLSDRPKRFHSDIDNTWYTWLCSLCWSKQGGANHEVHIANWNTQILEVKSA